MNRAIVVLWALLATAAAPAAAQQCTLEYQRADNMFAGMGRPDGQLGKETVTLEPGQTKVFTTDWKYEKQRNDGANYYGSHTRIVRNTGKRPMQLVFRGDMGTMLRGMAAAVITATKKVGNDRLQGTLKPGVSWDVRADLMEASCPSADKEAKVPAPTGLVARQTSPSEIVLTWQKVPEAKEYRLYVDPPPPSHPHLAGRPNIVSNSGTRWVIVLPPSVPPSTVYRASIEAVGANGAVSQRAEFNPVAVQLASGAGGTPQSGAGPGATPGGTSNAPSTTAAPSFAGQRCPSGQFVTGFDDAGRIICARPPGR
jgi:hypothetical protein